MCGFVCAYAEGGSLPHGPSLLLCVAREVGSFILISDHRVV